MVSLFLATGVDTSMLHEAVLDGGEEMTALLLGAGANANARSKSGPTAPRLAVQQKSTATANLLPEAGAEVSVRSKFGITALHFAVQHGIVEIVDLLLKAGTDTSVANSNLTRTILHEAAVRVNVLIVRLLLKASAGSPA